MKGMQHKHLATHQILVNPAIQGKSSGA